MDRHDMMCKYTLRVALEKKHNKCHHSVVAQGVRSEGVSDFWKGRRDFIFPPGTSD